MVLIRAGAQLWFPFCNVPWGVSRPFALPRDIVLRLQLQGSSCILSAYRPRRLRYGFLSRDSALVSLLGFWESCGLPPRVAAHQLTLIGVILQLNRLGSVQRILWPPGATGDLLGSTAAEAAVTGW